MYNGFQFNLQYFTIHWLFVGTVLLGHVCNTVKGNNMESTVHVCMFACIWTCSNVYEQHFFMFTSTNLVYNNNISATNLAYSKNISSFAPLPSGTAHKHPAMFHLQPTPTKICLTENVPM